MKYLRPLLLLVIVFSLAACAHLDTSRASATGTYTLTSISGADVSAFKRPVNITITESRISGDGPINRWSAPVEDGIIGMAAATRMAGPPVLMDIEHILLSKLEGARIARDSDQIHLVNGDFVVELEP